MDKKFLVTPRAWDSPSRLPPMKFVRSSGRWSEVESEGARVLRVINDN